MHKMATYLVLNCRIDTSTSNTRSKVTGVRKRSELKLSRQLAIRWSEKKNSIEFQVDFAVKWDVPGWWLPWFSLKCGFKLILVTMNALVGISSIIFLIAKRRKPYFRRKKGRRKVVRRDQLSYHKISEDKIFGTNSKFRQFCPTKFFIGKICFKMILSAEILSNKVHDFGLML